MKPAVVNRPGHETQNIVNMDQGDFFGIALYSLYDFSCNPPAQGRGVIGKTGNGNENGLILVRTDDGFCFLLYHLVDPVFFQLNNGSHSVQSVNDFRVIGGLEFRDQVVPDPIAREPFFPVGLIQSVLDLIF